MAPFNLSANALAIKLCVPATRIGAIVNERRGVTAETALRLARFFNTTPEFWMNLQSNYDLSLTIEKIGADVEQHVHAMTA
ncbi:MAG: HigA family addiction module antidote protein [Magnetococcales bacterium]|nr:HigA family addiction module antidote protein [Magnetococcales bacterium]